MSNIDNTDSRPANSFQVGGEHYSQAGVYQHWDFCYEFSLDYFVGVISKYLTRWRKKGQPVQDLEKARHYTLKLKELALTQGKVNTALSMTHADVLKFCSANRIKDEDDVNALFRIFTWKDSSDLDVVIQIITKMIEATPPRRIARDYDKQGKKTDGMEHPFGYDPEGERTEDR